MLIGGGRYQRSRGALGTVGAMFCWPEQREDSRPAPEKKHRPASCSRSRRAGELVLVGGKASEEGEGAGEARNYLRSRPECAPDLDRVGGGRRPSSGRSGDLQRLAEVGSSSGRSSGAPRTIR